jgi:hypothetical protein
MNSKDQAERPGTKQYQPPRLTVHGDVEDLTQGPSRFARFSDVPGMGRRYRQGVTTGS